MSSLVLIAKFFVKEAQLQAKQVSNRNHVACYSFTELLSNDLILALEIE